MNRSDEPIEVTIKQPIRVVPADPHRVPPKGESPEGDMLRRVDGWVSLFLVFWFILFITGVVH